MNTERKLIQIFFSFVEKALLPQIRKFEGSLSEWNKFSSLLSAMQLNYSQLKLYVDSLSAPVELISPQKPPSGKKKQQNEEIGFNPNKTFGGERSKFMFGLSEEKRKEINRDDSFRNRTNSIQSTYSSRLKQLLVVLEENQRVIEEGKSVRRDSQEKRPVNSNSYELLPQKKSYQPFVQSQSSHNYIKYQIPKSKNIY